MNADLDLIAAKARHASWCRRIRCSCGLTDAFTRLREQLGDNREDVSLATIERELCANPALCPIHGETEESGET